MQRERFETWRRRVAVLGQRQLADTVRKLIYRTDEGLFDRLDFSDDSQFLHPTLFAYFTASAPVIELPQLLYGIIRPDRRPASIRLRTNSAGWASLASVGRVETGKACINLDFGRDDRSMPYQCTHGGRPVSFQVRPPFLFPGTSIEVTTDVHPLFFRFFDQPPAVMNDATTVRAPHERLVHLMIALALIQTYCPSIWTEIAAVTRLIVLYSSGLPNSFAALSAHGAIFCNVSGNDDEIALLEDVAHQCAHVIFNALAYDPARVIAIDPATSMQALCGETGETRTVFEALHGLFTYTLICRVLTRVHDAAALAERQSHELLGRLGFTLHKFATDVERLNIPDAFTTDGRRCYDAFVSEHDSLRTRYGSVVAGLRYDNQPYVFDYGRFVERNGGPWPVAFDMAS